MIVMMDRETENEITSVEQDCERAKCLKFWNPPSFIDSRDWYHESQRNQALPDIKMGVPPITGILRQKPCGKPYAKYGQIFQRGLLRFLEPFLRPEFMAPPDQKSGRPFKGWPERAALPAMAVVYPRWRFRAIPVRNAAKIMIVSLPKQLFHQTIFDNFPTIYSNYMICIDYLF